MQCLSSQKGRHQRHLFRENFSLPPGHSPISVSRGKSGIKIKLLLEGGNQRWACSLPPAHRTPAARVFSCNEGDEGICQQIMGA